MIHDEVEEQGMEQARYILEGKRPHSQLEAVQASTDERILMRRSWSPPEGTKVIGKKRLKPQTKVLYKPPTWGKSHFEMGGFSFAFLTLH